jgi:hypothetical protein
MARNVDPASKSFLNAVAASRDTRLARSRPMLSGKRSVGQSPDLISRGQWPSPIGRFQLVLMVPPGSPSPALWRRVRSTGVDVFQRRRLDPG